MAVQTLKMPRSMISSDEFNNHDTVGEIKRVGKTIVIVNERGYISRISRKHVMDLSQTILRNQRSAIIKANGLSRAQVGRIVGDLKQGYPYDIYIRKITKQKTNRPQATDFEILLMDGNNNEG